MLLHYGLALLCLLPLISFMKYIISHFDNETTSIYYSSILFIFVYNYLFNFKNYNEDNTL